MTIPYLIIPPLVSGPRSKRKWKPSKREAQEAFLLQLNTIDELKPYLERQREKCLQNGDTLQPLPVIVGKDNNLKCFVTIDSYLFETDTVVGCVDTCFKVYHSLKAKYPTESQHIWYFLQKFIYDITEPGDKDYVSVNAFISDLKP